MDRVEPQSRMTTRQRAMALAGGAISFACWVVIALWATGRIATDQFTITQWLWWMPTVLVLFVPLIALVCAARPVYRARTRVRRLAVWFLVLLLVTAWFMLVDHRFFRRAETANNGLEIAHWNMSHPNTNDWNAYVEAANSMNADILVLSSCNPANDLSKLSTDPSHVYQFGIFCIVTPLDILGHRPLVNRVDEGIWSYMIELDASETLGHPIIVYLIDLPRADWQHPLSVFKTSRMDVARRFRELLARAGEPPPPDIVVGDFNMTRGSASLAALFPELHHAYDDGGHGYGATFPREWPLVHIDHVLLADEWAAAQYDVIDPGVSEHRAQRATIMRLTD